MPQAPTSSGCPPNDVTASTMASAPRSRDDGRHASRSGFSTPVEVSAWTIATTSAGDASSARRSASGSHALPHSTSSRVTVRPVALAHLREPIAEVSGDDDERPRARRAPGSRRRFPSRTVPVPDTANANEPSGARNSRASRARTSSRSAIMIGSRWLTVGDAIARITRGDVRLGPGPSRMRSISGSRLIRRLPGMFRSRPSTPRRRHPAAARAADAARRRRSQSASARP